MTNPSPEHFVRALRQVIDDRVLPFVTDLVDERVRRAVKEEVDDRLKHLDRLVQNAVDRALDRPGAQLPTTRKYSDHD